MWDLRSRQCLRVIQAPNKAPVSGVLLVDSPARLAGHASASNSSSSRIAPKRLQPLAQLAKYAGAATGAKPWEGPLMVLDAAGCSSSSSTAVAAAYLPAGLFLQPCMDPLALLQQQQGGQTDVISQAASGTVAGADAAAGDGDGDAAGSTDAVASLQQQVQQLQQQLQESRKVAEQWQTLHGQLHQFCTEQVLAAP